MNANIKNGKIHNSHNMQNIKQLLRNRHLICL